jgi:hypothetical protein
MPALCSTPMQVQNQFRGHAVNDGMITLFLKM